MTKIRLDDMTIQDVKNLYNPMFIGLISEEKLEEIYNIYLNKYNEMKEAEANGYKAPSGMGRRFNYLKNILYGWYIEELFYILLENNPNVRKVEFTGNDAEHNLKYNHKNKVVTISGEKTTNPDFLLTLNDGTQIYIELKTAAAEIYSIKIGNVKQLQKTMGFTDIYSMIIMVDLVHGLYEIKDISFFLNSFPFVNNRMEGQLCYDFPEPSKPFYCIAEEKFSEYINPKMFNTEEVKKYKCYHLAEESGNKDMLTKIKNKIALDTLYSEFEYQKQEFDDKVQKIIDKVPDVNELTWEDILDTLIMYDMLKQDDNH